MATLEQTKQGLPPEPDPAAAPAADEHLLLVPATLPQRLLAGAIDALVVSATAGGGALLLTLLVWGPLLGTDFAGSAQRKALAEWLLLANSLALALLYTFAQALGRPTAGDRAVGIRLVQAVEPPGLLCDSPPPPDAPPERQGWRFRLRWALANLPLIGMTLLCAAGALRTHVLGLYAFDAIRTHGGSHPTATSPWPACSCCSTGPPPTSGPGPTTANPSGTACPESTSSGPRRRWRSGSRGGGLTWCRRERVLQALSSRVHAAGGGGAILPHSGHLPGVARRS